MKRNGLALILALACCGIVGVATATAGAENAPSESIRTSLRTSNCPAAGINPDVVCSWTQPHYQGVESYTVCSNPGLHTLAHIKFSAKNSCNNRAVRISYGTFGWCMNPGGERPTVEYYEVYVYALGSRC